MPSIVDEVRMEPVPETDVVKPGSLYLACLNVQRKTEADSYWIVVRAPKEWLPDGFFDTRPVQIRVFPFWIVGKAQRVWLPRTSLFCLDPSQRHIFTDRQQKLDFCRLLHQFTTLGGASEVLKHVEREIVESTEQYNERRERIDEKMARNQRSRSLSSCMEDYTGALHYGPAKVDCTIVACAEAGRSTGVGHDDKVISNPRRREAAPTKISSVQTQEKEPLSRGSHPSIPLSTQKNVAQHCQATEPKISSAQLQRIVKARAKVVQKQQQIIDLTDDTMPDNLVRVFVGQTNVEHVISENTLRRCSPVLSSYISVGNDGGKFIMHPSLRDTRPDDFLAMLQFMQDGDYAPVIVRIKQENIVETASPPQGLEGKTTVEDYSRALIQSGRLFLLAKLFQIRDMAEFITTKVRVTQFQEYSNQALIRFARLIFTRPQPGVAQGFFYECIDRWTFTQLANSFMSIMNSNVDRHNYVEMVGVTNAAQVHACVLERAANNYRACGCIPMYTSDSD